MKQYCGWGLNKDLKRSKSENSNIIRQEISYRGGGIEILDKTWENYGEKM